MLARGGRRAVLGAARPYAVGAAGAGLMTAAMAAVLARVSVPDLPLAYVLLVLWVGSRHGRAPALVTSLLSFAAYDYFLVPPVGTLSVAGPAQALELVLLLAAALVTGQLAASLERARREAEGAAAESTELYALATSALRLQDVGSALQLLAGRAAGLGRVVSFTILAREQGAFLRLAGNEPTGEALRRAAWAFEHRTPLGCTLREGAITIMESRPARPREELAIPLTSGAVLAGVRPGAAPRPELRMLSALVGLTELLLERRRAILEADRRHAAEASDRLKTAVLSSLSHELKSPIASLRAGLTALASPCSGLGREQRELLRGLDGQALRLDRLVGDLLTMSRLDAGAPPELAASSFAEMVGTVLHQLRGRLADHRVTVSVPADLPPVMADEVQVHRLLTNLVENALDWTPAGGLIEIGAAARGGELAAWVANQGPAIPTGDLEAVFDKFWTGRTSGSGLGLAICRRIVEAHGGRIEVRNLRPGPRFTFTLALAAAAAAPA
ncbi:MAG: sensor histidine kinase [Candidatus Dormibacterales bacterium]